MIRMFRVTAVAALLLSAAAPALGQTAPAAPVPAAPAQGGAPVPPATVPPQPEVSPEKLALAKQVVVSSGMGRSFEPMVPQLEEQIPAVVTRTRPELSKDLTVVLAQLQPEFDKKSVEMLEIAARIYARHMSDEELRSTAAFFQSQAGRAYVNSQPLMLDELVVAMQSWTQQVSVYMIKRVQEEMEKKGIKF